MCNTALRAAAEHVRVVSGAGHGPRSRLLAGLGSGAALLEIEELCAELTDESARPSVQSGVCTLQCANAPVVYVQPSLLPTRHHSKVDGPQRCAEVVADAAPTPNAAAARGLMLRRADGLRWSALRQHAPGTDMELRVPLAGGVGATVSARVATRRGLNIAVPKRSAIGIEAAKREVVR